MSSNSPLRSSPPGRVLLGHQAEYARDQLGSLRRWADAYGDVVQLRFGPVRALLVTRPELVDLILRDRDGIFRKPWPVRRVSTPVIGRALFGAEGEAWQRLRVLFEPMFAAGRWTQLPEIVEGEVDTMLRGWRAGDEVDIGEAMMALSQRISARALFGIEASDADVETMKTGVAVAASHFQSRMDSVPLLLLPLWFPTRDHRRLAHAATNLHALARQMIETRRRQQSGSNDPLGAMLAAQTDHAWLSDDLLCDNLVMLLTESREDPALALTWAWYLLARDGAAESQLHAEIATVLNGRQATLGDLPRLAFAEGVVREALRLYPPAYSLGREALRDTEIGGITVRKGMLVLVSQWVSHRQSEYFDDPDRFHPERWTADLVDRLPPGVYFPFGAGPRRCLGEAFALCVTLLALASIALRVSLRAVSAEEVAPCTQLSLRPEHAIRLRVEPR